MVRIVVSDLQSAKASIEQTDDAEECLFVDLSGKIKKLFTSQTGVYILESNDIKTGGAHSRINPQHKKVLLSIKNFPDSEESAEYVTPIVECIAMVARKMKMQTVVVAINCNMGQNRSPLIAARLMTYLTCNCNKPDSLVYTTYKYLCYLYWREIMKDELLYDNDDNIEIQFRKLEPSQWPKICTNWSQEHIHFKKRGSKKYPTISSGFYIPKPISITMESDEMRERLSTGL
jgi:electron transfer flavoprotein alpha subunit